MGLAIVLLTLPAGRRNAAASGWLPAAAPLQHKKTSFPAKAGKLVDIAAAETACRMILVSEGEQTVNMRQVTDVGSFLHQRCRQTFQAGLVAADRADCVLAAERAQRTGEYR